MDVSVDCVVFGFDDDELKVLLIEQKQPDGKVVNRLAQEYSRIRVGKALKTIRGVSSVSEETDTDGVIRIRSKVRES